VSIFYYGHRSNLSILRIVSKSESKSMQPCLLIEALEQPREIGLVIQLVLL
jgi:hypothetical protein